METLFAGIPLDKVSTSMTINSPAAVLLAFYICVAEKQGVPPHKLQGTLQNDILKEYIAQKEFIFPPEPSMKLVVDTIAYCTKHVPEWNTISNQHQRLSHPGSRQHGGAGTGVHACRRLRLRGSSDEGGVERG
jgi:methylmalonyl-CoA mutase N-terminal domain/subunit